MKEVMEQIIQNYQITAITIIALFVILILLRVHHQLKRMNRNFSIITGKIQEYFNVILEDEIEETEEMEEIEEIQTIKDDKFARNYMPQEVYLSRQEKEMLLSNTKEKKITEEEEAIFNTVLKEYFS